MSELKVDLKNFSWILSCSNLNCLEGKGIPAIWGLFNSVVLTKHPSKTSVVMVPPLIQSPPTDMNVVYNSLMYIQMISKNLNEAGQLTVVTLNMQLYDMTIKL